MKVILALLAFVLVVAIVSPAPVAYALTDLDTVEPSLSGTITYNGEDLSGASVQVTCNGHKSEPTISLESGSYYATFPTTRCVEGDEYSVTATKDVLAGETSGVIGSKLTGYDVEVKYTKAAYVYIVGGSFVLITAGLGAFVVMRRRRSRRKKADIFTIPS